MVRRRGRESRRVLIIAHRGASAVAPESTRAAIREAARVGADMIELDVQLTRDRRLIVFHDDRLERTTNGTGRVTTTRYRALTTLSAGEWFHPRFLNERILLLSHAARLIPARMMLNLELKRTPARRALTTHFLRFISRAGLRTRLLVSSFDPRLLQPLRSAHLPLALICHQNPDASLRRAIGLGCAAWHPLHTLVTPKRLALAHAANLRVHAWTVDDVRRARTLIRLGVDGLFTNDPGRLIAALR